MPSQRSGRYISSWSEVAFILHLPFRRCNLPSNAQLLTAGELECRSLARVTTTVALNRKSGDDSRLTAPIIVRRPSFQLFRNRPATGFRFRCTDLANEGRQSCNRVCGKARALSHASPQRRTVKARSVKLFSMVGDRSALPTRASVTLRSVNEKLPR